MSQAQLQNYSCQLTLLIVLLAASAYSLSAEQVYFGGMADDFEAPADPAAPSADLTAAYVEKSGLLLQDFDQTRDLNGGEINRHVAHTFAGLPTNVVAATLEGRVKTLVGPESGQHNDGLSVGFYDETAEDYGQSSVLGRFFGPFGPDPGLLKQDSEWTAGNVGTFVLDLRQAAHWDGLVKNLIPELNRRGFLDVIVADDTAADYFRLTLTTATISKRLVSGPWKEDDTGGLVAFDANGDGRVDKGYVVGIGLTHAQHFAVAVDISNDSASEGMSGLAFVDALPEGFALDAAGEAFADSATLSGPCLDGRCDGISADPLCPVTLTGTANNARYLSIEPDGLQPEQRCRTLIYIETTRDLSTVSRGRPRQLLRALRVFNPRECVRVATADGGTLVDTVTLNDGVKVYFKETGDLLFGPVETVELQPLGCEEAVE